MKIPSITNFVAYGARYFVQSSWKGRTVQVLCAASFITLIYCLFFRSKKKPPSDGPSTPPLSLNIVFVPPAKREKPCEVREKPFEVDYSFRTAVKVEPDFVAKYSNAFESWLSAKIQDNARWTVQARGDSTQQVASSRALDHFRLELKETVNAMKQAFEPYPELVGLGWEEMLKNCDAITDRRANPEESCQKLKACLEKLQSWNAALYSQHKAKLMHHLADVKNHPHYEFANLHTQYLPYLGLRSPDDFSKFLSIEKDCLAKVGLVEMADIDLLQLRALQPSIEKLRQLFCFLSITGNEKVLKTLIEQAIEQCREVLRGSDNLSGMMKNSKDLKDNVGRLRGLFGELSRKPDEWMSILKKIEELDISRQLIQLKGYIDQPRHLEKWAQLNQDRIDRLSAYANFLETDTLSAFYQM